MDLAIIYELRANDALYIYLCREIPCAGFMILHFTKD